MRLPGRIAAAIEVLADIEARHRPVAEALQDWGLSHRFAGAGDRAAIGNLVYDALRRRSSLAWRMGGDTPWHLVARRRDLRMGRGAGRAERRFRGRPRTRRRRCRTTCSRRSRSRDLARRAGPCARRSAGMARAAFRGRLRRRLGGGGRGARRAAAARSPRQHAEGRPREGRAPARALRRRADAATRRSACASRRSRGRGGIRTCRPRRRFSAAGSRCRTRAASSARCSPARKPGEQVLDLCAGAGGKTLALAARMENRGQIFAYDTDRNRLAPIYDRLKRAGARNVQVRSPRHGALDDLAGQMDRVLVDAPCTGTGVWRRRPDAKWRLTPEALEKRIAEQDAVLAEAAAFVRPGGVLAYATCSLLPAENGERIAAFLRGASGFRAASDARRPGARRSPDVAPPDGVVADDSLLLSPRRTRNGRLLPRCCAAKADVAKRGAVTCRVRARLTRSTCDTEDDMAATQTKPIELHYWPTPNGWKITIMLEEARRPLRGQIRQHRQGRAVHAGVPGDLAEQPHAGDRRSGGPGRQADLGLRIRRDPHVSRPEIRTVLSGRRAQARRGRGMARLADRQCRPGLRPQQPFPQLRAGEGALRASSASATRRTGSTACWTSGSPGATSSPATIRSPTWR